MSVMLLADTPVSRRPETAEPWWAGRVRRALANHSRRELHDLALDPVLLSIAHIPEAALIIRLARNELRRRVWRRL